MIVSSPCITVEWSLPPRYPPISVRDILVNFLERCIAICLGSATVRVRRFDKSSETLTLNFFEIAPRTASILTVFLLPDISRETFLMKSKETALFVAFASLLSRAMAPSSSRILPGIFSARYTADSWETLIFQAAAFFQQLRLVFPGKAY